MRFTKVQGVGNDFVLIDLRSEEIPGEPGPLTRVMCDRHFGVGADGVLLLGSHTAADVEMRLFNADGTEAEMCGNGLRCVAMVARRRGYAQGEVVRVSTLAGEKRARIVRDDGRDAQIRVDMGPPDFDAAHVPVVGDKPEWIDRPISVKGREVRLSCVSMGNPHAVIVNRGEDKLDPGVFGPIIEKHPAFPRRTNVEFVTSKPDGLHVVVWERGAGFTMACGTGACAAVAVASRLGLVDRKAKVWLPGGVLDVEWEEDGHLYMLGPAREVFEGDWPDGDVGRTEG